MAKSEIRKVAADDDQPFVISLKEGRLKERLKYVVENPQYEKTPYRELCLGILENADALARDFDVIEHLFLGVLTMRLSNAIDGMAFAAFNKIIPKENNELGNVLFYGETVENSVKNIRETLKSINERVERFCENQRKDAQNEKL